jgi:hypothetical protein
MGNMKSCSIKSNVLSELVSESQHNDTKKLHEVAPVVSGIESGSD